VRKGRPHVDARKSTLSYAASSLVIGGPVAETAADCRQHHEARIHMYIARCDTRQCGCGCYYRQTDGRTKLSRHFNCTSAHHRMAVFSGAEWWSTVRRQNA